MAETIYHNHHIIPRHAGGSDDSTNLIRLTVEEHALAHKKLWEEHGRLQDKLAWLMLSGKTEEGELARKEMMRSPEIRAKISASHKGKVKSKEHRINLSKAHLGKKHTPEHIENCRLGHLGITTGWDKRSDKEKAEWKSSIARARAARWERTPMEERRLQSVKMNAIQIATGSWKAGVEAAAVKNRGRKVNTELVAKRNANQRTFYKTPEGKAVLAARGLKHRETNRLKKAAQNGRSAQIFEVDHLP